MRARIAPALIGVLGVAIAWTFAATVLRHTRPMALPLDESYAYLVEARQLARGQLAGASGLWSIVLAPLWLLGARGEALVWVAFGLSAALYVATALGVARIVRTIAGGVAGVAAAVMVLALAPFAASALAGSEAALGSALLIAIACGLLEAPATGRPPIWLGVALGAATLAGPELAGIAIAVVGVAAIQRARQRGRRAAAAWLAPLLVPLVWCALHRAIALPSHRADGAASGLWRAVWWDATSPLPWPRIIAVLGLVGAVGIVRWARRTRRGLAAAMIVTAPLVVMLGAAISGRWSTEGARCLAPALPFVMIGVGCALGLAGRSRHVAIVAGLALAGFAWRAMPALIAEARQFAQAASDVDAALVAVGGHLRRAPGTIAMAELPGAIGYVGDVTVLGLPASQGPGVLFEQLERLPPEQRPARFVIDPAGPAAPAIAELAGDSAFRVALRPAFAPRGNAIPLHLDVFAARWDHTDTGERPLGAHAGWAIVDRIDLADRDSEAAHAWSGALGVAAGDSPARWSVLAREVAANGLILDGGRTIRGGERFTVAIDPARPAHLVLRTGGARAITGHDLAGQPLDRAVQLRVLDAANHELASATLPAPDGRFVEQSFALPAGASGALHTEASAAYRAFHWFVLQPE